MILRLEQLTSDALKSLTPAKTVFFFPVGGLEDHGSHLPLGLDSFEAHRLCELAVQKLEKDQAGWTGVIMPAFCASVDSNTNEIRLQVRGHVLRDWLVDACMSLVRAGFLHFVCFSGTHTPRQLTAIEDAAKIVRRKSSLSHLSSFLRKDSIKPYLASATAGTIHWPDVRRSPLWPDPIEHGGKRDTSVALALCPDLVKPHYQQLPLREPNGSFVERAFTRLRNLTHGYVGSPAQATKEWGVGVLENQVEEVFPKLRAVLQGSNPGFLFRTWYSVFPPNKSFFHAWILFFSIFGLFSFWVWFSLYGLA